MINVCVHAWKNTKVCCLFQVHGDVATKKEIERVRDCGSVFSKNVERNKQVIQVT